MKDEGFVYNKENYGKRVDQDMRVPSASWNRVDERGFGRRDLNSVRSNYGKYAYGERLIEKDVEGGYRAEKRSFIDRATDEVASWFGDEDAERRRRMDELEGEKCHKEQRRQSHWPSDVRARDVMTRTVVCVTPYDKVEHAALIMRECDCGSLPVVNKEGRLRGMVTDRDITVRLVAERIDMRRARVADCMTGEAFFCHENDSIEECMRRMAIHQVRRLPVVDDRNRVVGIVSQGDLAQHAGEHPGWGERRAIADAICSISEPTGVAYR
jgi:CBS domain-containing protein